MKSRNWSEIIISINFLRLLPTKSKILRQVYTSFVLQTSKISYFAIHFKHYFNRLCAYSRALYEKKKSVVWLEHQVILTYIITFIIYLYRLESILSGLDSPNWIIRDLGSPKSVDPTSRVLIQKEQLFVTPLLIFILLYFTMRIRRLKLLAHNLIFRRHTTLFE